MRVASLNMQNLRLLSGQGEGRAHLFGARDRDALGEDPGLDGADRRLTAALLARCAADVLCLQEVFDAASLDFFHNRCLVPLGLRYPHRVCVPGNDGRGLDVAVLSRRPFDVVRSHAGLSAADLGLVPLQASAPDAPVFRRDCLEVRFGGLTLFVVHFKAPFPEPERAWAVRRLEAQAVAHLVGLTGDFWLVLGDFNEPEGQPRAIAPLEALGVTLGSRLPEGDRWTWYDTEAGRFGRPDGMIASPALARSLGDRAPQILRCGLGREVPGGGARLPGVGGHRPHASDHAAMVLDLPSDGPWVRVSPSG